MLTERAAQGKPLRVGLIGAGKFGAMYLAQIPTTPGIHLAGHRRPLAGERAGEPRAGRLEARAARRPARSTTRSRSGLTHLSDDWRALVAHPEIEIIVEATGNPIAAVDARARRVQARQARRDGHGRGRRVLRPAARPKRAAEAGVDLQPRVWRPAGADLRSRRLGARRGLRRSSRPAAATSGCRTSRSRRPRRCGTYYGPHAEQARVGGLNPKMFNSFLDGSKPAIESTAVSQRDRPDAGAGRAGVPACRASTICRS